MRETDRTARAFKIERHYLDVRIVTDIEPAFAAAAKKRIEALLVLPSAVFNSNRKQIVDLAAKNRWPGMYPRAEYVEDGGLMTYGASTTDLFRRAAIYVDKILKGAKPGNLPVEQSIKFDLMFNLKAAKHIGVVIPEKVLARADRVIK